jgi:crotonobetainyl-CoA:carnitine CoA-transferase CaiB-like acyl-CoA transferase
MTGRRDEGPETPGVQVADLAGGALWGATAILAALYSRHHTGVGAHLDISMTEGALALLVAELGILGSTDDVPTRGRGTLNGGVANYGVYSTKDGRYLAVGALEPKFWQEFNAAIGRRHVPSEIVAGPAVQDAVRKEVGDLLRGQPLSHWVERFAEYDCCVEPVLELDELAGHPLHVARGLFFVLRDEAGNDLPQLRTPVGTPTRVAAPPTLGQHSREVLLDYGFNESEVDQLLDGEGGGA